MPAEQVHNAGDKAEPVVLSKKNTNIPCLPWMKPRARPLMGTAKAAKDTRSKFVIALGKCNKSFCALNFEMTDLVVIIASYKLFAWKVKQLEELNNLDEMPEPAVDLAKSLGEYCCVSLTHSGVSSKAQILTSTGVTPIIGTHFPSVGLFVNTPNLATSLSTEVIEDKKRSMAKYMIKDLAAGMHSQVVMVKYGISALELVNSVDRLAEVDGVSVHDLFHASLSFCKYEY